MDYYDKTVWENGDTITADLLNKTENCICDVISAQNNNLLRFEGFLQSVFGGSFNRAISGDYITAEAGGINPTTGQNDDTVEGARTATMHQVQHEGYYSVYRYNQTQDVRVYLYDTGQNFIQSFNWRKGLLFYINSGYYVRIVDYKPYSSNPSPFYLEQLTYNYDPSKFELPSSTPGSTKKFQISVDDSGTITATEVQ